MLTSIFIFAIALVGTIIATDLTIKNLRGIGKEFLLSDLFLGLTVAAVGTSLPELAISLKAGLKGADEIIIGNIVGSNIANISLLLGICGLLTHFFMRKKELKREGVMFITALLMMLLTLTDRYLSPFEAVILIVTFFVWIAYIIWDDKILFKEKDGHKTNKLRAAIYGLGAILGFLLLGLSAHFVVESATIIATKLNISQYLIAVFLIGVGSSLPELVLSLQSILQGHKALSIGTLIGSNITNPLLPLGVGAIFNGAKITKDILWLDIPFLFLVTITSLLFLYSRYPGEPKKHKGLTKTHAIILITLFISYAVIKII